MKIRLNITKLLLIFLLSLPIVFASSANYYAKTTVYFNIPSDASFRIAMPSDYTFTSITGTDYTGATATSPSWISFNFTIVPSDHVQPYAGGESGKAQNGVATPIFYYDPSGTSAIKLYINLTNIPTGISVGVNGTCTGSCTSPKTTEENLTANTEMLLVTSLPTTSYFNCTLWGYVDNTASAGESSGIIYHHSTVA